jgi:hypothetical protein
VERGFEVVGVVSDGVTQEGSSAQAVVVLG